MAELTTGTYSLKSGAVTSAPTGLLLRAVPCSKDLSRRRRWERRYHILLPILARGVPKLLPPVVRITRFQNGGGGVLPVAQARGPRSSDIFRMKTCLP